MPELADGAGPSLQKTTLSSYGNDAVNWQASECADGSPGEGHVRVPRRWLIAHGYTNDFSAAELTDSDGDGMLAWQEYEADTIPTNCESVLQIYLDRVADRTLRNLRWNASGNRYYTIERFTNLMENPVVDPDFDHVRGISSPMSHSISVSNAPNFYRLKVEVY